MYKVSSQLNTPVTISYTGDLAAAVRNNTDIHFGLYYSLYEWFHPLWVEDRDNKHETQYYVKVSCSTSTLMHLSKAQRT